MELSKNHAGIGHCRLGSSDKTDPAAKADQSEEAVPANRLRLDDRMNSQLRHLSDDIVVDFGSWVGLAYDEAFRDKLRPLDLLGCSETVILVQRNQYRLGPEGFDDAAGCGRLSYDEANVHPKRLDVTDVNCRRPLDNLQIHFTVIDEKGEQKITSGSAGDRGNNPNAERPLRSDTA